MTAAEVLHAVNELGVNLELATTIEGERIRVSPSGVLSPYLIAAVQNCKPDLLKLLRLLSDTTISIDYGLDVLGEHGGITAADLIAETEALGAELYLRPGNVVGIRNGALVPDNLLLKLARANLRLESELISRSESKPAPGETTRKSSLSAAA
jgi:hypothetical protein